MTRSRWGRLRWAWVALLLLVWMLRLPPLLHTPLHSDEALYGTWGLLIGQGGDPWLAGVPVDKPPLSLYALTGFQLVLGNTKAALRFFGLAAGMVTVPLTAALASSLYGDRWTGALSALGVALSPFAVVLSGSAFPDPAMVALGTAACLAAVRSRPAWSGLLAGLSFATKQTGLVWVLPSLLLVIVRDRSPAGRLRLLLAFFCRLALAIGLVVVWDLARGLQGGRSFWQAGVAGFGGPRLIWPQELWPRLREWLKLLGYLFGSPTVNALLLAALPVLAGMALVRRPGSDRTLMDALLVAFLLLYVLLHWLVAFPTWDRYLLPLVPILAVLLGRITRGVASHLRLLASEGQVLAGGLVLGVLLLVPALEARAGCYPVGQELAAYEGIDEVTSFLAGLPEGAVVYHHWLGYHYRYTLWDAPVYLSYWPDPAWLAQDVEVFGGREPRYVVFPPWESPARVEHHLDGVGYGLAPVRSGAHADGQPGFTVYRIQPSSE